MHLILQQVVKVYKLTLLYETHPYHNLTAITLHNPTAFDKNNLFQLFMQLNVVAHVSRDSDVGTVADIAVYLFVR